MKNVYETDVVELNIFQIVVALLRKCWVIMLCVILCAGGTYWVSDNVLTPYYESTVTFYVNNASFAADNRLSSSDLYVSENLMSTYMVILNAGQTLDAVAETADVEISREQLEKQISMRAVPDTVLLQVTVTGTDAAETGRLAQGIAQVLPDRINAIMEGVFISVADAPLMPQTPATPNVMKNTICAILFGFVFGASIIVLRMMFNTAIKTEEDIPVQWNVHVLASVPAVKFMSRKKKKGNWIKGKLPGMTAQQAESYKFLRAKLSMLVAEDDSHVIGITSALAGEGKSTTAVNLAGALAEEGHSVLLMDCDLRRPTVHEKLHLRGRPGVSEMLANHHQVQELLKMVRSEHYTFHVLTSGMLPPNPVELLNSRKMQEELAWLRQRYNYIIMDLPPVGEVSDALAAASSLDGYILVTRANHCSRNRLKAAIDAVNGVNRRLLGVVLNGTKK